jgi:hypothetical protein
VLICIRLIVGAGLLVAPSALQAKLLRQGLDRLALAFTRILGARHLAQAVLMTRRHTRDWILAGAAVDASHAATMAILAGLRPERRAFALTSAACATMFASTGIYATRHASPLSSLRCDRSARDDLSGLPGETTQHSGMPAGRRQLLDLVAVAEEFVVFAVAALAGVAF